MNYSNPMPKLEHQKLIMISLYVLRIFNIRNCNGPLYTHLNIPSLQAKQDSCSLKMSKLIWTPILAHL